MLLRLVTPPLMGSIKSVTVNRDVIGYNNASTWGTRRQILSVIADLTTFERMQAYIPDLTELRFKKARKHKIQHGRGVPLSLKKRPRLRVSSEQLDHFLTFITSPPVIQDLPFGQRYLHLSSGQVLETPNVIDTMKCCASPFGARYR